MVQSAPLKLFITKDGLTFETGLAFNFFVELAYYLPQISPVIFLQHLETNNCIVKQK